jgi:hypothetical protein
MPCGWTRPVDADPLPKKVAPPTMTREAGPLHRPRFPDAREDDEEGGGA